MDATGHRNAVWRDDIALHALFIQPFASWAGAGMERAKERGDCRSRPGLGNASRSWRTFGSCLRVRT
jgi:hypothetical protein